MKYKVKESEEMHVRFSFLDFIDLVMIDHMITEDTARVFDVNDGIYFDIEVKHLIPISE